MSKPLEMPIHPKLKWPRRGSEIEPYRKQWKAENALRLGKRFTDAELAAEVLIQERDHWRDMSRGGFRQDRYDRLLWIRRFAAAPSYDEAEA